MNAMIVFPGSTKRQVSRETSETEDVGMPIVTYRSSLHKLPENSLVFGDEEDLAECIHALGGPVPIPKDCKTIIQTIQAAMANVNTTHHDAEAQMVDTCFLQYPGFAVRLPTGRVLL